MRKLATVRKIDSINHIPDADSIEVATVGGWKVVIKKGEFSAGDLAVYCEIDSWIPTQLAPFLSEGQEPREFNEVKGERLRTVKLRGQVSQGLLIPGTICPTGLMVKQHNSVMQHIFQEGDDVSEWLGIQKWEAPIPAQLSGEVRGAFPGFIPKTDQERVQNLTSEYAEWQAQDLEWEVTEKLDGSSMTVYVMDEDEGVCSRNLNLRETEGNTLWRVTRRENLIDKIRSTGRNLALQGELVGEGIQSNPYKFRNQEFHLFDVYDIDKGRYLLPQERQTLAAELNILQVPGLGVQTINCDIGALLTMAEGKSLLHNSAEREGLVFKCATAEISFKCISNLFLLNDSN